MKLMRLTKIEFDNLENDLGEAIVKKEIGLFEGDEHFTAQAKVGTWFRLQNPFQMYLGWDGQVYPQFKTESVNTK